MAGNIAIEVGPKRVVCMPAPSFAFAYCSRYDKEGKTLDVVFAQRTREDASENRGVRYLFAELQKSDAYASWVFIDTSDVLDATGGGVNRMTRYRFTVDEAVAVAVSVGTAVDAMRSTAPTERYEGEVITDDVARSLFGIEKGLRGHS